jgi:pyridinium-3,5-biscarboxylic acid mononucleotide sulfurtransferase
MKTIVRPDAAPFPEQKYETLRAILQSCGSACVGYSGGVDSVLLARVCVDTLGAARVLAVTGLSPAYPAVQRRVARGCALRFGIPHVEIETSEVEDPRYASNPANRCYYCKAALWPKLLNFAREHGYAHVLDGSNADDAHDYRPGFAAGREHGIRSPLLEAGLTKAEIRQLSRRLGLPTWDQPSAPCLSSRLPYGVAVTTARLRAVEDGEAALRALGFIELRVRHHDDCARIELAASELPDAWRRAAAIDASLRAAGFSRVLLDAEGYRRGALNEVLVHLGTGTTQPSAALPPHDVAGFHGDIAVVRNATPEHARAHAAALRGAGFRYVAVDLRDAATVELLASTGE